VLVISAEPRHLKLAGGAARARSQFAQLHTMHRAPLL